MGGSILKKIIGLITLMAFIVTSVPFSFAQSVVAMPATGTMVTTSAAFVPAILKGMKVYPKEPLRFDFIVDAGNSALAGDPLKDETTKLARYFLASLTTPEKDLWVNLSPYEKERIIPDAFGQTEMGRDLLAEDYILKQLTSSLMYPENATGKEVWKKIYAAAAVKLTPSPIPPSAAMTTVAVFSNHNAMVRFQRAGELKAHPPGALVAGHQKDVVITAKLASSPGKVAIYGWHQTNGIPIQPLYLKHTASWVDYSQCIRLVQQEIVVNGDPGTVAATLASPELAGLLSSEGLVGNPRYPTNAVSSPSLKTTPPAQSAQSKPALGRGSGAERAHHFLYVRSRDQGPYQRAGAKGVCDRAEGAPHILRAAQWQHHRPDRRESPEARGRLAL